MNNPILAIAPMIQWTDRHWRYLFRLISKQTILYTEMTMDDTLIHNNNNLEKFIGYSKIEEPLVLQLGGSDPVKLGEAAYLCERYGNFHEINLNCGCPSNKAKSRGFGAELMLQPSLVKQIVSEMKRRVCHTEITVKCRLGVTGREAWEDLIEFINEISSAGVRHIILHARMCMLKGLSTGANRSVPPLMYDWVHTLVNLYPEMKFTLNGGVTDFETAKSHLGVNYTNTHINSCVYSNSNVISPLSTSTSVVLQSLYQESCEELHVSGDDCCVNSDLHTHTHTLEDYSSINNNNSNNNSSNGNNSYSNSHNLSSGVHGIMIGREAYHNPLMFAKADSLFFHQENSSEYSQESSSSNNEILTRRKIITKYLEYAESCQEQNIWGSNTCNIIKPLHNIFTHTHCNNSYKRTLDRLLKLHSTGGRRQSNKHQSSSSLETSSSSSYNYNSNGNENCCYDNSQLIDDQNNAPMHRIHSQSDNNFNEKDEEINEFSSQYINNIHHINRPLNDLDNTIASDSFILSKIVWTAIHESVPASVLDDPILTQ